MFVSRINVITPLKTAVYDLQRLRLLASVYCFSETKYLIKYEIFLYTNFAEIKGKYFTKFVKMSF
jgi:hypothetical protein